MQNNTSSRPNLADSHTKFAGAFAVAACLALAAAGCGPDYPNCDDDEDCQEGEFCVNKLCQQCRDDRDCSAGQQCAGGRCEDIPGHCTSNGDCPDGQECQDNRCTVIQSMESTEQTSSDTGCTLQAVYFDFDADGLDQAAKNAISENLRCIKERSMGKVHLTGHTDPRGTEEYNLALGDRRARAVGKYLSSLGSDGDSTTSSMGEEQSSGQDEASYARDRRVDFTAR